jgi:hypothetical protein
MPPTKSKVIVNLNELTKIIPPLACNVVTARNLYLCNFQRVQTPVREKAVQLSLVDSSTLIHIILNKRLFCLIDGIGSRHLAATAVLLLLVLVLVLLVLLLLVLLLLLLVLVLLVLLAVIK